MNIFNPSIANGAQTFAIPGGVSGSAKIYLKFSSSPSAGAVTFEIQRPGSTAWTSVQNASSVDLTSGSAQVMADGGFSVVRLTFSGIVGGSGLTLAVVDNETGTPASDLLTDGGFGASRRIRVDPGQTGFFSGKFFRAYIESLIPVAGPSVQFRFTSPVDFILWLQSLELTQGGAELRIYTGATGSGTWTQRPVIGVNRMIQRPQPYYSPQCTLEVGGNFSGGTEVDVLKVRASAANDTAQNVGDSWSERGLPGGIYYGRLQTLTGGLNVNDPAQLIYSLTWEERP
jgi:hypothetical protein